MMRAPTSGLLRQWRCHSPSGSVKERNERRWWMRRRRASRSTWAGGLGPGALLPQLGQRRAPGRLQQVVLGGGVGRSGVGDGAGLLGRQLAPAGGGGRLGQRLQAAGGVDGGCGLDDARAGAPGQVVGRRAVTLGPPRAGLGHPGRGQGLDGGGHLLDPRRLLDHLRGLGRRQHGRVEPGGVLTQRFPQLRDPHAHSRATVRERATYRGKSTPALPELVFVSYPTLTHHEWQAPSQRRNFARPDCGAHLPAGRSEKSEMTTSTSVPFIGAAPPCEPQVDPRALVLRSWARPGRCTSSRRWRAPRAVAEPAT